jgi:tRNA(Ile)-lysidine synthase
MATVADALIEAGVGRGARLVVAVSGGADSMVLLHALVHLMPRLGTRLHVAHIHHGLRGRSADRDAALVSTEADRYGVAVSVERLAAESRRRGTSVQVWARDARYARLEAIRKRKRAAWILTAHTQNDQAETLLLNLLRGTGPRGLAGIPPVRGRILRPLLTVSRAEIEAYAASHGVAFREDPSNRSVAYRRNRIRRQLLPLLAREYNPRIVETLAALASQVREDEAFLVAQVCALAAEAVQERKSGIRVHAGLVGAAPPALARRLFQEAFHRAGAERLGLTRRHLAALAQLASHGGRVLLPGGLVAWASAKYVWLSRAGSAGCAGASRGRPAPTRNSAEVALRPGRWMRWEPGRCLVRVQRAAEDVVRLRPKDPCHEILSPDLLTERLSLRAWRPGDRFQPLGLAGQKKLQDFFVDTKIPRAERGRVPLLMAGQRIAWVVGRRIADVFRWKGEGAACVAEVRFLEGQHGVSAGSDAAFGG